MGRWQTRFCLHECRGPGAAAGINRSGSWVLLRTPHYSSSVQQCRCQYCSCRIAVLNYYYFKHDIVYADTTSKPVCQTFYVLVLKNIVGHEQNAFRTSTSSRQYHVSVS
jgi:hypothetical protein